MRARTWPAFSIAPPVPAVSSFSAGWLALREPADHAARSKVLTRALVAALPGERPLRVLDLAAGTGSNARYLTAQLTGGQEWLLVDHDRELLAQALLQIGGDRPACRVETRERDLARLTIAGRDILDGRALVTASALLDLVSEEWLRELSVLCRESGAAVLFALSYDGRIHCSPEEPDDVVIRDLVNLHQRTDKGFGPALGAAATDVAARCFAGLVYRGRCAPSDWVLTPDESALQRELIAGWADAAIAIAPDQEMLVERWRACRLAHVDGRRSRLTVGHEDLAGWL